MRRAHIFSVIALLTALAAGHSRAEAPVRPMIVTAASGDSLRTWDADVTRRAREGSLRLHRSDADPLVEGRTHDRFAQYFKGVRVHGGDMTRQGDRGVTVSVFGTFYADVDLDVAPRLSAADARRVVVGDCGVELGASRQPELVVLPDIAGYRLVYNLRAFTSSGGWDYFIDAQTGAIVRKDDALRRQAAVGSGTGVLGDRKKVSASALGGGFVADDALRPPFLGTFDMRGNLGRTLAFLNGVVQLGDGDLASTASSNVWTDQADVDAHVYAGYVYDYYFKRFGRRGLDNNNFHLVSVVHPVDRNTVFSLPSDIVGGFLLNAFYVPGEGVMVYGDGLPAPVTINGQHWNYLAGGLDVVGHELTHGVTDFTSNLIYRNESGALNEAFSDMMAASIEFFFQEPGSGPLKADYVMGEDVVTPGGLRSLANPAAYGDPDHYQNRYRGNGDNGGVHTNSAIAAHAFYLAIEGGTNRTSGLSVQGVGPANREQIEKVMYRAFTLLLPSNATFAVARLATIQAARDLYGVGSAAERAVTQAWTAVGVN